MNRQEAAKCVGDFIDHFDELGFYEYYKTALEMAQDALKRTPVIGNPVAPDPDTGLVPCGCGERVSISFYPGWAGTPDLYQVDCFSCHVGTRPCQTAEQAKAAWNTAMGWKGGAE